MNNWKVLLKEWSGKNNGLTLPYLIGYKKYLDSDYVPNPENDINNMFYDILSDSNSMIVSINYCINLREPVLGLMDDGMSGVFPVKCDGDIQNKFFVCESMFSNSCFHRDIKFEEIIVWAINTYSTVIVNKQCSKNNFIWTDYTLDEVSFINAVLGVK